MTQPHTPEPVSTASTPSATNPGILLAVLAALFAAGLVLLYTLTNGGAIELPGAAATANSDTRTESASRGDEPAAPALDLATSAEVAALQVQVAEARARIDTLSEQSAGFSATLERVDRLEADVAEAKAAADVAARRSAQVAERYSGLIADYSKVGAQFTADGVLIRLDESAVAFEPGTAVLPANAETALTEVAGLLRRHPEQRALLRGHTDASGRPEANRRLSEQRAAAVRAMLVAMGVPAERVGIEGIGAAEPIADNLSAAGRSKNRRVEVLLRPSEGATG